MKKYPRILNLCISSLALTYAMKMDTHFIHIKTRDEYNKMVKENKEPMVVQFAASWCSVCQNVKQPYEDVAMESEFKNVMFARVDVDELSDVAQENNVMGIPTHVYQKDGEMKDQSVGVESMEGYKDELRTNVRKQLSEGEATAEQSATSETQMEMDASAAPEQAPAEMPQEAPAGGFMDMIKNVVGTIIDTITSAVMWVINSIRGLFGN